MSYLLRITFDLKPEINKNATFNRKIITKSKILILPEDKIRIYRQKLKKPEIDTNKINIIETYTAKQETLNVKTNIDCDRVSVVHSSKISSGANKNSYTVKELAVIAKSLGLVLKNPKKEDYVREIREIAC